MGNQANVTKFCCENKQSTFEFAGEDILHSQYFLSCQICAKDIKHSKFKEHLDQVHFSEIQEISGNIYVKCLLCEEQCESLQNQEKHIDRKHPYAVVAKVIRGTVNSVIQDLNSSEVKRRDIKWNKHKKQAVLRLPSQSDYQIIKKNQDNSFTASVKGLNYSVETVIKEYRGSDYEPNQVAAQLIWFKIFKSNKKIKYYFLDEEPRQKSIFCKVYLFYSQEN